MYKNTKLQELVEKLDGFFLGVIVINAIVIYFQVCNYNSIWLQLIDSLCTIIFIAEMVMKIRAWGFKNYWKDGWNRMDFILVTMSIPTLLTPFAERVGWNLGILLIFRLLRVLKFFRLMKIFPNFTEIMQGFRVAMKKTWAVLAAFALLIFIFALINCSLFRDSAPEYFSTPLQSFYSVFRLFTIEGWYDIPDALTCNAGPVAAHLVRIYFCLLLILGGIIGMSLINSIFVDAMAEDNKDEVLKKMKKMEKDMQKLQSTLDELNAKLNK